MKCPSCLAPVADAPPACPACGFELGALGSRFGTVPRYGVHVTDATMAHAALTPQQFKKLETYARYFERKFPQARFSTFFVDLQQGQPIREYAFYLMNRCQLSAFGAKEGKNFSLLLLVDSLTGRACLMTGYGLEDWLEEMDLETILAAGREAFARRKFYRATKRCVGASIRILRAKLKSGHRAPATEVAE